MAETIMYTWRELVADDEMVDLVKSHGGTPSDGWWSRVSAHSLGWVSARNQDALLVGFVNVAWDGGDHAFLLDTKTRGSHQHRGIGRELVRQAAEKAGAAGCEWLHVDFEPDLAPFYLGACAFRRPTPVSSICRRGELPGSSRAATSRVCGRTFSGGRSAADPVPGPRSTQPRAYVVEACPTPTSQSSDYAHR